MAGADDERTNMRTCRRRVTFLGRASAEGWAHPAIVTVRDGMVLDITSREAPTRATSARKPDPAVWWRRPGQSRSAALAEIDGEQLFRRARSEPAIAAVAGRPQAVKAAGVTFVVSLLERVIEEQARGSAEKADAIRADIASLIGHDLSRLKPGSAEAPASRPS